jgi:Protein of unknown function (DUF981)
MELVMQVTYNELMGVCAGLIMIVVADALKLIHRNGEGEGEVRLKSHAYALGVLGTPLAALGFLMSATWPLTANTPVNIVFGEPSLILGVLALFGAVGLTRGIDLATMDRRPVVWVIAAVGLVLASISSAIFSYRFMGSPPPSEPITGQIDFWANGGGTVVWGIMYAVAAVGCLATLLYRPTSDVAFHVIRFSWIISGTFFLLFSVLNFRTHIGQIVNLEQDANFRW